MFELKIKGGSLEELKSKVKMVDNELNGKDVEAIEEILDDGVEEVSDEELAKITPETVVTQPVVETPVIVSPVAIMNGTDHMNGVEVDSQNVPWDSRIHTGKRTKNKTGDWKLKRGVDKAFAEQIKNEIRLANAPVVEAPVISAPVVQAPAVSVPVVQAPVVAPLTQPIVPVVAQTTVVPVAPAPVLPTNGGHTLQTFSANFPMIVGTLITEKKINQEYVEQLKTYFNTEEIWNITDTQKAELFESFAGFGFITKV